MHGLLDGENNIAAVTFGDGSCGLHALFGDTKNDLNCLYCAKPSVALLNLLPVEYEDVFLNNNEYRRNMINELLEMSWQEGAVDVARSMGKV